MSKIYRVKQDRIELMKGSCHSHISWIDLLKEEIIKFDWGYCIAENFNNLTDAIHRFNELKLECVAFRKDGLIYPLMYVDVLQLEEVTIDEYGEEEDWDIYDEYTPNDDPAFWDFENDCFL